MEDIYTLLNINNRLIKDFPLRAKNIIDHQTELAINRNIRSLNEIEDRLLPEKLIAVSNKNIDFIIKKVINDSDASKENKSKWTIRELRILSYYLIKLQDKSTPFTYAIELLEKNWKNSFFNGLTSYILDNWNTINIQRRKTICELLRTKLSEYQGPNRRYVTRKNHANLLDEPGPARMAAMILATNTDIKDSPSLLGNRPSTITQSYYSDVIINYCAKKNVMDIDLIKSIFELHNLERTNKLVLADLVERINQNDNEENKIKVVKLATQLLGDITISSNWAPFLGASDNDAKKLKRAKELVNLWLNKKTIETFFEICVQDRLRKEFWLRYINKLEHFKIVGSQDTKRLLRSDHRIGSIFYRYFIQTDAVSSKTSALVLFFKNKVLVEFSDMGALYAYNKGHKMVKNITDPRICILSTNDLKIPAMNNIIENIGYGQFRYYEEGRMTHQGDWPTRLSGWMSKMVISQYYINVPTVINEDDLIFKAKPFNEEKLEQIRTQEIKPQSNQINYETKIHFSIASKLICKDKCRIGLCKDGLYLSIINSQKFIKLNNYNMSYQSGSIWIRKPKASGWKDVLHVSKYSENQIGLIKETNDGLLFKKGIYDTDFIEIKLS